MTLNDLFLTNLVEKIMVFKNFNINLAGTTNI
jgi:hypothetical protein